MNTDRHSPRSQVGIGTLAVFIAMVLVALLAGGVLIETTGLLQGNSAATSEDSSDRVTDRVGVESATASYSSGSMDSIDVVLSKAPGSGDIDLSSMVIHWLGPNGSSELTESTISITPIKGSGTVLEERSDRLQISNFGKTIPDGMPATVRFITADGGTTTVILRPPNAPPSEGDVSLLWQSPSGNPASGSGSAKATATATATPTGPQLSLEWTFSDKDVKEIEIESGTSLYAITNIPDQDAGSGPYYVEQIDAADGSTIKRSKDVGQTALLRINSNDKALYKDGSADELVRWNPSTNTTTTVYTHTELGSVNDARYDNGDLYLAWDDSNGGELDRTEPQGSTVWDRSTSGNSYYVDTDSSGAYIMDTRAVEKYDHDSTKQWETDIGSWITAINAHSGDYVYVADTADTIHQLHEANGTETSFSYTAASSVYSIDVGPNGYVYVPDGQNVTILDPADGSVVHRKQFSAGVEDIEVDGDKLYFAVGVEMKKFTVSGLP